MLYSFIFCVEGRLAILLCNISATEIQGKSVTSSLDKRFV